MKRPDSDFPDEERDPLYSDPYFLYDEVEFAQSLKVDLSEKIEEQKRKKLMERERVNWYRARRSQKLWDIFVGVVLLLVAVLFVWLFKVFFPWPQ